MLQQYDLSIIVFLKISSISSYCWCSRNKLLPRMKLSMSTTRHCPNLYFPSHSTKVYSLYLDYRNGGATIQFQKTTKCSYVFNSSGMGSQSTESLTGVLTRTNTLITILSYPLYMSLLVQGFENFQLSSVRYKGVKVVSPYQVSSAQRWYSFGFLFSLRLTDSPLIISASTILQLSFIDSAKVLSSRILKVYPFCLATSNDLSTFSFTPSYQYSSMNPLFFSMMEQRLALQILSKQSVIVVGWILQQLITLSGRYPNDSWQVFLLTPQRMKGIYIFLPRSILSNQCFFLRFSILSLSQLLTSSRYIIRSTEQTPASCCFALLIGGIIQSRSLYVPLFQRPPLLKLNDAFVAISPCGMRGKTKALCKSLLIFLLIIIITGNNYIILRTQNHAYSTFLFSSSESGSSSSGGSFGLGSWNSYTSSASTLMSSGPSGWKGSCEDLAPYPIQIDPYYLADATVLHPGQ